jgi:hypothetical protein
VQYYAIWWEGKTVQRKVGRKFWQKPLLLDENPVGTTHKIKFKSGQSTFLKSQ